MASKYFIAVRPGSEALHVAALVLRLRASFATFEDFGFDELGNREWEAISSDESR